MSRVPNFSSAGFTDTPADMELANLEYRLAGLRERPQAFVRQSDLTKRLNWIAIPIVAVVVLWVAFTTQKDPGPMLFLFSILISIWAVAAWVFRHSDWSVDPSSFHFATRTTRYTSYRVF